MGMTLVMDGVQSIARVDILSSLVSKIEVAITHELGFIASDGKLLNRHVFAKSGNVGGS